MQTQITNKGCRVKFCGKINKSPKSSNKIQYLRKIKRIMFLTLMVLSIIVSFDMNYGLTISNEASNLDTNQIVNDPKASYSGDALWNQTWGLSSSDDGGNSVWGDGTYLFTTGYTDSFGAGSTDLLLIKWDLKGTQIWNKTWGGVATESGLYIWGDGTYLYTTGVTNSSGAGSFDLIFIKWDFNGTQIWTKYWGGTSDDRGSCIWGDGTYLYTAGYTASYGEGNFDTVLIKWDLNGTQIWYRTWGGFYNDVAYSIWGDGVYLYITGYTYNFGAGSADLFIQKWRNDGYLIWYRTWGGTNNEVGYEIWGDGTNIYLTGYTYSHGLGLADLVLIKFDLDGILIWYRTWGGPSYDYGVSLWGDGSYIYTAGRTRSYGAGDYDLLILKWDLNGTQIWNKTWGGPHNDYGQSIWGDGNAVFTIGCTTPVGTSNVNLLMVKWDLTNPTSTSLSTTIPNNPSATDSSETNLIIGLLIIIVLVSLGILVGLGFRINQKNQELNTLNKNLTEKAPKSDVLDDKAMFDVKEEKNAEIPFDKKN
jgi:hypothetical protein